MTRNKLARELNDLFDFPYKGRNPSKGDEIVRAILNTMAGALQKGDYVRIDGFGTLKVKTTTGGKRTVHLRGTAPPTTYVVRVKPRKYVFFKPATPLLRMIHED